MRPRPDAAENTLTEGPPGVGGAASMRPRPDAAENTLDLCCIGGVGQRFNEAAARCRGKPRRRAPRRGLSNALQ